MDASWLLIVLTAFQNYFWDELPNLLMNLVLMMATTVFLAVLKSGSTFISYRFTKEHISF